MDKTLLVDLKRKLFIRSSLLAISSLDELLGLNDYLSADEILLEIIKAALREFELSKPLILEMKMNRGAMKTCYGMEGFYEIKSNFTLYLDCLIGEDQIVLVPNSIPKIRVGYTSYPTAGAYNWVTEYRRPYIFLDDQPNLDFFYLKGICSRPIIPDFLPDKSFNPNSSKAAIYWMNIEEGAKGVYFMDLCLCHLLDYLRQLKASVQLPSFSVDVLSNLDAAYQELRSQTQNDKLQCGWDGELID